MFLQLFDARSWISGGCVGPVTMVAALCFLHPPVNVVRDSFFGFGLRYFTLSTHIVLCKLFEQIIVFQAGVRRNTLAWNNRTGPCIHHLNFSLFVGFEGHGNG